MVDERVRNRTPSVVAVQCTEMYKLIKCAVRLLQRIFKWTRGFP